MLLTSVGLVKK